MKKTLSRIPKGREGEYGRGSNLKIREPESPFEKELDEHGLFDGRSKHLRMKEDGRQMPVGQKGRPKGSRNKLTLLKQAVMQNAENVILENLEEIVQQACKMAKRGDTRAMKLVMDRILPARKVVDDVGDKMKTGVTINITGNVQVKEDIEGEVVSNPEETDNAST